VADGLVQSELGVFDGEGPVFGADRAELAAGGAGQLIGQGLGLLLQEGVQSALDQTASGGGSDLFHGLEVEDVVWAGLTEGAAGDDFAPLGSECTDFLELLGRELRSCHGESSLRLTTRDANGFLSPLLYILLYFAKGVLASCPFPMID
jgi:hypothetical protein